MSKSYEWRGTPTSPSSWWGTRRTWPTAGRCSRPPPTTGRRSGRWPHHHLTLIFIAVSASKNRRVLGFNKYKTRHVNIELKVHVIEAKQSGRTIQLYYCYSSHILVKSWEKLCHVSYIAGAVRRNLSKDPGECGQSVLWSYARNQKQKSFRW